MAEGVSNLKTETCVNIELIIPTFFNYFEKVYLPIPVSLRLDILARWQAYRSNYNGCLVETARTEFEI